VKTILVFIIIALCTQSFALDLSCKSTLENPSLKDAPALFMKARQSYIDWIEESIVEKMEDEELILSSTSVITANYNIREITPENTNRPTLDEPIEIEMNATALLRGRKTLVINASNTKIINELLELIRSDKLLVFLDSIKAHKIRIHYQRAQSVEPTYVDLIPVAGTKSTVGYFRNTVYNYHLAIERPGSTSARPIEHAKDWDNDFYLEL